AMKYVRTDLDDNSELSGSLATNSSATGGSSMAAMQSDDSVLPVGSPGNGVSQPRRITHLHRLGVVIKRCSYLEKLALLAVLVLLLIVLILACMLYNVRLTASSGRLGYANQPYNVTASANSTCTHPVCVQLTARLLSYMNESADPCEDFYEFSCGLFRQRVTIPAGRQQANVFSLQSGANEILLRSLLESASPSVSADADINAELRSNLAALYRSCLNESAREEAGLQPLLDLVAPVGPWAACNATARAYKDGWTIADGLLRSAVFSAAHSENPPFFYLGVTVDIFNTKRRAVHLSQSSTLLLRDDYVHNRTANLAALAESLEELAKLFGLTMTAQDVRNIIELERKIAEISLPEWKRRGSLLMGNSTIKQLQEDFPCINWTSVLLTLLSNSSYAITNDTPVNLHDRSFFEQLCPLLNQLSSDAEQTRLVNNYLLVRSIWPLLPFTTPAAYRIPEKLTYRIRGVHGTEAPWKICVQSVDGIFGFPLGKLFVDSYFLRDSHSAIERLIDSLMAAFNASLADARWMDEATRRQAVGKLDAIRRLVGYPHYFNNATELRRELGGYRLRPDRYFDNVVQIQRESTNRALSRLSEPVRLTFGMTPQSVNAYYSPSFNAIAFPAGILQQPFYRPQFPAYVSYGAIGAVIGHEITHGFDDSGRHHDRDGNKREWWSNGTVAAFDRATDCIARQYEAFTVDGNVQVSGQLVLGESIADNGGLKMAYRAYKQQQKPDEPLLPYLGDRYSREQVLFLAYAQTWCELITPEALRQLITVNTHPPGQMRVWGSFSKFSQLPLGPRGQHARIWTSFRLPTGLENESD
ncbi:hypothetical protein BOX15_Mlig017057g1, partial [Macrostomum lignano]